MKCPGCKRELSELAAGEVTVDVCRGGCGGVWFDDRELKKFDEQSEVDGELILTAEKDANIRPTDTAPRSCPRCPDEVLCRRFYDIQNQVTVDQCLKCSGIFLDTGELQAIRGQYRTESDRNAAADAYLSSYLDATKEKLGQGYDERLRKWETDVELRGTLRSLFAVFFS